MACLQIAYVAFQYAFENSLHSDGTRTSVPSCGYF